MNRSTLRRLALVPAAAAAAVAPMAHAALDAAVSTGIETAKTDLVTLLSTMTAAGIVVFVAAVIYRRFKVK